MEDLELLEGIFDRKKIAVLRILFSKPEKQFYLQELAENASVPIATVSRIVNRLASLGVIEVTQIAKFKLYKVKQGKSYEFLSDLFKEDLRILDNFIRDIEGMSGLKRVILHGKESKKKANILLIGENLDHGRVKTLCAEYSERFHFKISSLSLTEEQYVQMSQMGLYPGQKKLLLDKMD